MFRKADKERLKRIETTLLVRVTSTDEWLATIAAQLKALSEGQDKLMQSHAALEKQLLDIQSRLAQPLRFQPVSMNEETMALWKDVQYNLRQLNKPAKQQRRKKAA